MSRKATPYQPRHGLTYAIEVVSMASNGDMTCQCKFYVYEVEVGVVGRKRKQRSDIQYFTKPFLPGHHVGQHGASWTLYQLLLVTKKKAYFDDKIKHTNTLHAHMDMATDTFKFVIRRSIVETIIDDLFFRDDEQFDECSGNDDDVDAAVAIACKVAKKANQKTNAMRLFDQQDNGYIVTIKNIMRFELTMDHILIGMSFRQTAVAIQHAKDRTKTTKLTGMNDLIVGQYMRVLVAVRLQ
ncbi:unnamed protein product [Sphagnum balticum]